MESMFIGRVAELNLLNKLFKKTSASLVVIQGRRRIGKSRLVEEFAKEHTFYEFSGLLPTEHTTAQSQRNDFSIQLSAQTGLPEVMADDWSKLFILLSEKTQQGRIIVLLDEITWMGYNDPDFLGKLKNAWDVYFKKNPQLIMILCGSISIWIEKNILSSTGFLGRISLRITLEELSLKECNLFWRKSKQRIAPYEKFKVLAVTGGIPRYLEEIKPSLSAEENIHDLCFTRGGALVHEFDEIFSDLFSKKSPTYQKIVLTLRDGPLEAKDICNKLGIEQTGFVSECLDHLIKSGFIKRDYTWHIKSGALSKLSRYRLSDNYIRFYLKYVQKNQYKIMHNDFAYKSLALLPQWLSIIALQFENLVLNNKTYIKDCLNIKPDEVIIDHSYFQRSTARQTGCQIDYLIQTKYNTLYLCEIKFKQQAIGMEIIAEMENKINNFVYPKQFSCRPVLIHVNGVQDEVIASEFFSNIIDLSDSMR